MLWQAWAHLSWRHNAMFGIWGVYHSWNTHTESRLRKDAKECFENCMSHTRFWVNSCDRQTAKVWRLENIMDDPVYMRPARAWDMLAIAPPRSIACNVAVVFLSVHGRNENSYPDYALLNSTWGPSAVYLFSRRIGGSTYRTDCMSQLCT